VHSLFIIPKIRELRFTGMHMMASRSIDFFNDNVHSNRVKEKFRTRIVVV
jgi:hypothetical protein